jgi:class 3 adenylate cyclase
MKRANIKILILLFVFLVPLASKAIVFGNINTVTVEDSAKINKLLNDAKAFEEKKDYQRAVEIVISAMDLAEKVKYEYGKYKSYKALEILYRDAGKPMLSAKYKLKAINSQAKLEEINYDRDEKERLEKIEKEKVIRQQQEQLQREQEELKKKMDEIVNLENDKTISKSELERRKLEIQRKQLEIENKRQTISLQAQTINTANTQLSLTMEELATQKLQAKVYEDSLQITKKNEELANNEIEKQTLINYLLILGISGLIILAAFFYRMYTVKKGIQDLLMQKNGEIETEKKRSDDLLLNILPQEVAEELKRTGKYESRYFDKVTVMFTDFKDFTKISELVTPKKLVEDIDFIFRAFDDIMERNQLEKIKTIGDAYLCVSGLPDTTTHNPMNVLKAATEIQDFIKELIEEKRKENQPFFDIRIGIHTGPLVAGIVGAKKFAFDIWGDTVNTAARMEQNCEPGKINLSGSTFKEVLTRVEYTYRGKVEAKNKGEIDMYYLNRIFEL